MVKENTRILVVDDEQGYCEVLKTILTGKGYAVETCNNGKEALTVLEKSSFDIVISDLKMPVMDGYQATKAIRALERKDTPDIPIIAMTANAFAEDERVALSVGMNAHLTKPLETDSLKRAVERFVEKGNSHGQR